jgi:hypothetical protein
MAYYTLNLHQAVSQMLQAFLVDLLVAFTMAPVDPARYISSLVEEPLARQIITDCEPGRLVSIASLVLTWGPMALHACQQLRDLRLVEFQQVVRGNWPEFMWLSPAVMTFCGLQPKEPRKSLVDITHEFEQNEREFFSGVRCGRRRDRGTVIAQPEQVTVVKPKRKHDFLDRTMSKFRKTRRVDGAKVKCRGRFTSRA